MEIAFVWVMCAVTAAVIAGGKQRSVFGWFLLGLLFSVFAVVMVAFLPRAERRPMATSGKQTAELATPLPVVDPRPPRGRTALTKAAVRTLDFMSPPELSPAEKQRSRQDDGIGTAAALVIGGIGILVLITLIVVTS